MDWAIGILIDVILVLIVVICAKKGSKDGFAKTLVSFFGFFIALVIAAVACTPVAEFCYDSTVSKPVETETKKLLDSKVQQYGSVEIDAVVAAVDGAIDTLPGFMKNSIKTEKVTENFKNSVEGSLSSLDTAGIAQSVNQKIIRPSLVSVLAAVSFVIIFVVLFIACKILSKCLKLVNKLPLLGKVNGLLGGILGTLKGVIIVILINWVMVFLVGDNGSLFNVITMNTINSSLINNLLTKLNPLNIVFSKVFHA
jgi:uncharacterized membrane protein required for colicin V production